MITERLKTPLREVSDILINSDLRLLCLLHGFLMIAWGSIGMFIHPEDLIRLATDFIFFLPVFWGLNIIGVGMAYIYVAIKNLPQGLSLGLGTYVVCCWTWIAVSRPVSSVTSGVTLNLTVIIVGALLIHRSGRQRDV